MELTPKEEKVLRIIDNKKGISDEDIANKRGIYQSEVPRILKSLKNQQLIVCYPNKKLDFSGKGIMQTHMTGRQTYKEWQTCAITIKGKNYLSELEE